MQVITLSLLFFSLSAKGFIPPSNSTRVYCFYVPQAIKDASPLEKLKNLAWEKLMDEGNPKESKKIKTQWNSEKRSFEIDQELYKKLGAECQKFIGEKGEVVGLKGTDAGYAEFRTSFYVLEPLGKVQWGEKDIELGIDEIFKEIDQETILPKLPLTKQNLAVLESVFGKKPEAAKEIKEELEKSKLPDPTQKEEKTGNTNYLNSAVSVAAVLASIWFGPALISYGTQLLYPLVYHALFGIPSVWNPTYWLVYMPGKQHAAAWALQNATAIKSTLGALWGVGKLGYNWYQGKQVTPEELEQILSKVAEQIKALQPAK